MALTVQRSRGRPATRPDCYGEFSEHSSVQGHLTYVFQSYTYRGKGMTPRRGLQIYFRYHFLKFSACSIKHKGFPQKTFQV
jgi:hypothetical protein